MRHRPDYENRVRYCMAGHRPRGLREHRSLADALDPVRHRERVLGGGLVYGAWEKRSFWFGTRAWQRRQHERRNG